MPNYIWHKKYTPATEFAWAAGIIDGEGCIFISTNGNGTYTLRVNVSNTDPRMLIKLKMYGGRIRVHYKETTKRRAIWAWEVSTITAYDFLRLIYPYLVIKKEQAEIAISFQETKSYRGGAYGSVVPQIVLQKREEMYNKLKLVKIKKHTLEELN